MKKDAHIGLKEFVVKSCELLEDLLSILLTVC